jgi:hypothetical protein
MRNLYSLPKKVEFCSKCVYSNQLPSSIPEYLHKPSREGAKYINFRNIIGGSIKTARIYFKRNIKDKYTNI